MINKSTIGSTVSKAFAYLCERKVRIPSLRPAVSKKFPLLRNSLCIVYSVRFVGGGGGRGCVNFLIFVTFKIKDFEGHYFKPVVLQSYTQLGLMNIVYFDKNHVIEVQEHVTNWISQFPHICVLQN